MKLFILLISILSCFPLTTWAQARIYIDGRSGWISLTAQNSADLDVVHPEWAGNLKKSVLLCESKTTLPGKKVHHQITFVPNPGGEMVISFAGPAYSSKLLWTEYHNMKLSGATVQFRSDAPVNRLENGAFRGALRHPVRYLIDTMPGQAVTLEFDTIYRGDDGASKPDRAAAIMVQPPAKYAYSDRFIKLAAPEYRGRTQLAAPRVVNRPAPSIDFLTPPEAKSAPRTGNVSISVELLEEDASDRPATIRTGLPIPRGEFFDTAHFRVLDADNTVLPANFSALGRWDDGSVKWLFCDVTVPLKAHQKKHIRIEGGAAKHANAPHASGLAWKSDTGTVQTGKLTCTVAPGTDGFPKKIKSDGILIGDLSLELTAPGGEILKGRADKIALEESGPASMTLRVDGEFVGKRHYAGYTARIRFRANSSEATVLFTFRNNNLTHELHDYKALRIRLTPAAGAAADKLVIEGVGALTHIAQMRAETFLANGRGVPGFMPERGRYGKIGFALRDAGPRYPKAIDGRNGLSIELLPELPGSNFGADLPGHLRYPFSNGHYRMMSGVQFTDEIIFDFAGSLPRTKGVIPVIDRGHLTRSQVLPGIAQDGRFDAIDRRALEAFDQFMTRSARTGEYGFLNYGDWFGERGGNWGNNEYDFAYGLFHLFFRTGRRDVFRRALATARHQADVDIIHETPFDELKGGNCMHTVGHTGSRFDPGRPPAAFADVIQGYARGDNGHSWSGGMLLGGMLAGDAPMVNSALLLGEHLIHCSAKPYSGKGNPRSHGWMLEALMQTYDATGNNAYFAAAKKIAHSLKATRNAAQNGAWAYLLPPTYANGHPEAVGNACFQVGVVTSALAHYAKNVDDPETVKTVADAAGWLRKNWDAQALAWPYTASWDGKALTPPGASLNPLIAAPMLQGSHGAARKEGGELACRVLDSIVLRSMGHSGDGKTLAMNLVMLPVLYEAMIRANINYRFSMEQLRQKRSEHPGLLRIRTTKLTGRVRLTGTKARLTLDREFIASRPDGGKSFSVSISDPAGKTIWERSASTRQKRWQDQVELTGAAGDEFMVHIHDDLTGYWHIPSPHGGVLRFTANPKIMISGGYPMLFKVRSSSGCNAETIQARGVHQGLFGMALFDGQGKEIKTVSGRNVASVLLPWIKEKPEKTSVAPLDLSIPGHHTPGEKLFYLLTWSERDLELHITGNNVFLEI